MSAPPPARASVREVVEGLAARWGEQHVVEVCAALIEGAPPERYEQVAVGLSGHGTSTTQLRRDGWREYWWRTWGGRGLLYLWHDSVAPAVVRGLDDEHWRPAEMCLKAAARWEIAGHGVDAVGDADAEVRRAAARALERMVERLDVPTDLLP